MSMRQLQIIEDGVRRNAKMLGDPGVGPFLDAAEHPHRPRPLRELCHGLVQMAQPLAMYEIGLLRRSIRGDVADIGRRQVVAFDHPASSLVAQVVERNVAGRLEQEGFDMVDGTVLDGLSGPDIGLLRDIFRRLRVTHDPQHAPHDGFAIAQENIGKGRGHVGTGNCGTPPLRIRHD